MVKKLMRRLVGVIWDPVKDVGFQQRAERKAAQIEKGAKVLAPHHPSEEESFHEAQKNKEIRKELDTKHPKLAENLEKINVKSTDPEQLPEEKRKFPTRQSEFEGTGHATWTSEFGFYEPPPEQLKPNRLSFREAVEILRAKLESEPDEGKEITAEQIQSSSEFLREHPAVNRVDKEKLDLVWEYFRPFARRVEPLYTTKRDLQKLEEVIEDRGGTRQLHLGKLPRAVYELATGRRIEDEAIDQLPEDERSEERREEKKLLASMEKRRKDEVERLEKRLAGLKQMDAEIQRKAGEDAETKEDQSKKPTKDPKADG